MGHSATVAINERCDELRRNGRRVFKLGLGQSPFPVPEPVVQALRDHAAEKAYLPVTGLPELREAVAEYYRGRYGVDARADGVLVGPGSKELMFLLQLVYYGDLVIPTPAWVSYAPQAHIIGRRVHWVATGPEHAWRLSPDRLAALCRHDPGRPRIVVLNYPKNPIGVTYGPEELAELAEVAAGFRVVLLSDEIYGELHHDGAHRSIAPCYPAGTIVSGGLSKWCGAGGWRLGVFVFPEGLDWLGEAMAAVASETYTSTSAPIQHAAVRAYELGPEIDAYLVHSRRVLRALARACAARLADAGAEVPTPQGAFYLFPDFGPLRARLAARGVTTNAGLCARLLEDTGVACLPAADFGSPYNLLAARLSLVDFDGGAALRASQAQPDGELDETFLRRYCEPVVEAVDRIADWVAE